MPASLGQLIHVLENVFSRVKHSSDIPGAPWTHMGMQLREENSTWLWQCKPGTSAGTKLIEMYARCLLNACITEQFLQIITSSHTAMMSVQNVGKVRQKSLLCAIQLPFPSQATLCLISQSLTSRCTNYCYFWSQSRIFHPHLENALRAVKTFRHSRRDI